MDGPGFPEPRRSLAALPCGLGQVPLRPPLPGCPTVYLPGSVSGCVAAHIRRPAATGFPSMESDVLCPLSGLG